MPLRKRAIIVTMASPLPPMTRRMTIIAKTALYGVKEAGGTVHVRIVVLMDRMAMTNMHRELTGRTGKVWSIP